MDVNRKDSDFESTVRIGADDILNDISLSKVSKLWFNSHYRARDLI